MTLSWVTDDDETGDVRCATPAKGRAEGDTGK